MARQTVRVKYHHREVQRVLQGEGSYRGIAEDVERRTRAVADAAGPGHDREFFVGHDRYHGHIYPQTYQAKMAEYRLRALTRLLYSVGAQ